MKIIDLLNKIANGEEVPRKIYYDCHYYIYKNGGKYTYGYDLLFDIPSNMQLKDFLNEEVEIIGE